MTGDDVKYLPVAAVDDQVKIKAARHFHQGPFDKEENSFELRARVADNEEEYWMKLDHGRENEPVSSGIDNYNNLKNLVEMDTQGHDWIKQTNHDSAADMTSPSYDEMHELREKYRPELEDASNEAQKEEILEQMWEEAAEMELDGRDNFG